MRLIYRDTEFQNLGPIMEKPMEKHMDNETECGGFYRDMWALGLRFGFIILLGGGVCSES